MITQRGEIMDLDERIHHELRSRHITLKGALSCILWVLAISLILLAIANGCSSIKVNPPPDITRTVSCPIADDITCQKCHTWKKVVAPHYDPNGKLNHFEMILPSGVDIDFAKMDSANVINPKSPGTTWVCQYVFLGLDQDNARIMHIIYSKYGVSYRPPNPPLCLIQVSRDQKLFWIYHNGVPVEVEKAEFELYILSLKGGVKT